MVVKLMCEDGDRLIDLDELKLFGKFRECDEETERRKYMSAKLVLKGQRYSYGDRLAVRALTEDGMPYAMLTTNLIDEDCPDGCAFVDTNNCPWAERFLVENEIAVPTGKYGVSGFCDYPLYKFDMSKLGE